MKAKLFKTIFDPIEIELQDEDGESLTLKQIKPFTVAQMKKFEILQSEKTESPGDLIIKQLQLIFGKETAFWEEFDVSVLAEIIFYISEVITKKFQRSESTSTKK